MATADPFVSASTLARAIRRRELSPLEAAESYLDRIDRVNDLVNAIIWRDDDALLAAAGAATAQLEAGLPLSPFHGVPMPIKDLANVAGQPNTYGGSLAVSDAPRADNDLIVDRLLDAGFLLAGRSNSPEAGMIQVTENRRYGVTRNPWDPRRTPGGSSGGAAAAVAAGIAPAAHGSDGGGSIRMPAACTGLVGLKPSRTRVPAALPSWENCTTGGVITRTVEDTARILDAISADDPWGWYRAPHPPRPFGAELGQDVPPLRIGLMLDAPNSAQVDAACADAAEALARLLAAHGHTVVPVDAALVGADITELYLFTIVETALHTVEWDDPAAAEPYIVSRMARAAARSAADYVRAVKLLQLESRRVLAAWGERFDVLLTPTLATRVPDVGVMLDAANAVLDGSSAQEAQMMAFTAFANVTGQPAISVPCGRDRDGLPLGAQLVGRPFEEWLLVRLSSWLESELAWTVEHPPVWAGSPGPAAPATPSEVARAE